MYPQFLENAISEKNAQASTEFVEQISESKEHAEQFKAKLAVLEKAEKRFKALKGVEERHANAYKQILETL